MSQLSHLKDRSCRGSEAFGRNTRTLKRGQMGGRLRICRPWPIDVLELEDPFHSSGNLAWTDIHIEEGTDLRVLLTPKTPPKLCFSVLN